MWSVSISSWVLLLYFCRFLIADEGIVKTVAGGGTAHSGAKTDCVETGSAVDGERSNARFNYPWGIAFDPNEDVLYVADCGCPDSEHSNDKIRKIHISTGKVTTLAGSTQGFKDGVGQEAHFHHPAGMVIDSMDGVLYVTDSANDNIRAIELKSAQVRTFVGSGEPGYVEGIGTKARFQNPQALTLDRKNRRIFVSDTDNHAIRIVTLPAGEVSTLAGGRRGLHDGVGKEAKFHHPTGISFDDKTGVLYVADHYNHVIRTVNTADGSVRTLAGGGREGFKDGKGKEARFHYPEGVHFDAEYQVLYVVEFDSNAIRMVTSEGDVSTFAGGTQGYRDGVGKSAQFFHPTGLTFDSRNKIMYVTDQYNHMVRSITARGSDQRPDGQSALSIRFLRKPGGGSDTWLVFVFLCLFILVFVLCCRPLWRRWFRNHGTLRAY